MVQARNSELKEMIISMVQATSMFVQIDQLYVHPLRTQEYEE